MTTEELRYTDVTLAADADVAATIHGHQYCFIHMIQLICQSDLVQS